ncbi:MAG: hypothetical protein RSD40_07125 [Bacilli bacterium]
MITITTLQKTGIPKISKEYFDNWLTPLDTHGKNFVSDKETFDSEIYERIGYIIASIWNEFSVNLNGWVFSNNHNCYYDEEEEWEYYNTIGFFDSKSMLEDVSYETSDNILTYWQHNRNEHKKGLPYHGELEKSFPTRWIYTDFEDELKNHAEQWKRENSSKLSNLKRIK